MTTRLSGQKSGADSLLRFPPTNARFGVLISVADGTKKSDLTPLRRGAEKVFASLAEIEPAEFKRGRWISGVSAMKSVPITSREGARNSEFKCRQTPPSTLRR
jgi:hypothetical protein